MVGEDGNVENIRVFDVELLVRNASDGKKYLYDIKIKKEDVSSANSLKKSEARRAAYNAARRGDISKNSISNSEGNVNGNFSLPIQSEGVSPGAAVASSAAGRGYRRNRSGNTRRREP